MLIAICIVLGLALFFVIIGSSVANARSKDEQSAADERNAQLEQKLRDYQSRLNDYQSRLYRYQNDGDGKDRNYYRYKYLELEAANGELETLTKQVEQNKSLTKQLNDHLLVVRADLGEVETKRNDLASEIDELRRQKGQLEQEKSNLAATICELMKVLDEDKKTHQQALKVELGEDKGNRIRLEIPPRYQNLYELIRKLKTSYPEIAAELAAGIEWKRIWLPLLQDAAKLYDLGGACGIYKLTLKSDESKVYIGQAVDIKARWYQHAKKMIGAETAGNEKLYEMVDSPDEVFWEVVERDVPQASLNEKEHYWIDYYKSNVIGLNIKG